MEKQKPSFKAFFWFPLETVEMAKFARMPALILSIFRAAIWSIIAIVGIFESIIYRNQEILYAVLYIVISWGLLRMRREAAIAGFIISLVAFFFNWGTSQAIRDVLMLLIYGSAINGTFAYARLCKNNNLKNTKSV
jgi:hypothetical protein